MMKTQDKNTILLQSLRSDCSKCSGLCCTALFFHKWMDFQKRNRQENLVFIFKRIFDVKFMENLKKEK